VDQGLMLTPIVSRCDHVRAVELCVQALCEAELVPVRGMFRQYTLTLGFKSADFGSNSKSYTTYHHFTAMHKVTTPRHW